MSQTRLQTTVNITPIGYIRHVTVDATHLASKNAYVQGIVPYVIPMINQQIDILNAWIKAYNEATEPDEKAQALNRIKQGSQYIQDYHRGDVLNALPDLQNQIHKTLFQEIQTHTELLSAPIVPSLVMPVVTFDEMLSGMSADKLSQFLEILSHGANINFFALSALYPPGDTSLEAQRFDNFKSNYNLDFLGGNNAQNFKLTNTSTLEETVVKVEYRMGSPKLLEKNLRHGVLQDRLAPVFTERQASFNHAVHGPTTCCLVQTALVKGGDLEACAKRYPDEQERFAVAVDLYGQMCDVFLAMESNQTAFPDAKNTNWLVDDQNRLQLADTKSFIPINPDGKFIKAANMWQGFLCILTPYVSPPEIIPNPNISNQSMIAVDANAMHVYMLGKNLYQFVTDCPYYVLSDTQKLNFELPVFKTPDGILLKNLIQHAIQDDPAQRIRVEEVKTQLATIQANMLKQKTHATLDRLIIIDPSFIENYTILRNELNKADNLGHLQKVHSIVKNRLENFQKQKLDQCQMLNQEISTLLTTFDNQQPSAFQTHLDITQQTLQQNKDNPELLIELQANLTIQKDCFQELNHILAKINIHSLPQSQQQAINIIALKGAKMILETSDPIKLKSAKDNLETNFMNHANQILNQPSTAKKVTEYKAAYKQQIEQSKAVQQPPKAQEKEQTDDHVYNPMHGKG